MPLTLSTRDGVRYWEYEQSTPSSTWEIYHAFGEKPIVDILAYDGGVLKKAFPLSLVHVDDNNITVTWTSPTSGIVSFASTQL